MKNVFLLTLVIFLASCGHEEVTVQGLPGSNGQDGAHGPKGKSGEVGATGPKGDPGSNGVGCTIASVSPGLVAPNGGAIVTCSNGSVLLLNGAPGANGAPAPVSPYQIDLIYDPCEDASGITDEIVIKLHNGTVLSSVSDNVNGYNTRLSLLGPNTSWITTDGSRCYVNIDVNLNITSHY